MELNNKKDVVQLKLEKKDIMTHESIQELIDSNPIEEDELPSGQDIEIYLIPQRDDFSLSDDLDSYILECLSSETKHQIVYANEINLSQRLTKDACYKVTGVMLITFAGIGYINTFTSKFDKPLDLVLKTEVNNKTYLLIGKNFRFSNWQFGFNLDDLILEECLEFELGGIIHWFEVK